MVTLKFPQLHDIFGFTKIKKGVLKQCLAAFCAALSICSISSAFVWIAPLLVRLKRPGSELPMTADEASWVVSLIEVGDLVSTIPAGFLVDRVGRKPMLLATGPMLVFSWLLVLSTRSVGVLYVARVVQGIALGMVFTALPLYLAEVAGREIRGSLGYFFQGMWYVGNLYEYSIGPYFSYDTVAYLSMIIPIVFVVTFSWFPESPYLLLMKGREVEAGRSLAWLRGCEAGVAEEEVEAELWAMKAAVEEEAGAREGWRELLGTRAGLRSLAVVHIVGTAYTMSGGTAMFSYATDTFAKAGSGGLSADTYTIILGSTVLLFVPFSGRTADRWGRRPVMLASCIGGAACLLLIAVFFFLKQNTALDLSPVGWIPFLGFISYTVLIGAGVEAVFPVLQAELFPNNTRGVASGLSHFNMTLMSFFCLKMYQVISDGVGLYLLFGIFAFFASFGAVLIYFFVPETKGKMFWEIQKLLE